MQDHRRRHFDFHAEMRRAAHAQPQPDAQPEPEYLPVASPDNASPIVVPGPSKILGRDADSDWSATTTCTSQSDPGCQLPSSAHSISTNTIIGLSVALPIVAIIVVLIFLHRRSTKKLAAEDKNYADKDLDWGTDAPKGENGKADYSNVTTKGHGPMMSIDLGNPYMLPPDVHGSRDSLHSLSRTVTDSHDPYRMVKTPSIRSGQFGDGSSQAESQRHLLVNGQPMSNSPSPLSGAQPISRKAVPNPFASPDSEMADHTGFDFGHHDQNAHPDNVTEKSVDVHSANRLSNQDKSLPATPADALSPPPRGDSKSPYTPNNNAGPVDPYAFHEVVVPPSPEAAHVLPVVNEPDAVNTKNFPHPPPPEPEDKRQTLGLGLEFAGNRLSVLRPLPPDDPEENPEQRANRIRSFYKEYFSDNDARGYNAGAEYYEDYGDEYLQDGTVFDPDSGQFIVAQAPYAAPVTRRAMTPPPRGPPPKFRGGPRRPGHMSSGSSPGVGGPRGRAYSNASTSRVGMGGPRGRAPKRPLPPPSALKNLPTPALLKEESFGFTMDFAPPSSYADRAAGRPESPFMEDRPYNAKLVGSPLASAFTELAVVPSPHSLRKSGTFTALDFAPPPRFRDPESMSDAGSIRSGRSNFSQNSARHQHNIRSGAYRLSRLPQGAVGSKSDIMNALKPKLDMINRP